MIESAKLVLIFSPDSTRKERIRATEAYRRLNWTLDASYVDCQKVHMVFKRGPLKMYEDKEDKNDC